MANARVRLMIKGTDLSETAKMETMEDVKQLMADQLQCGADFSFTRRVENAGQSKEKNSTRACLSIVRLGGTRHNKEKGESVPLLGME
jgi:hypothetical protein